ncbi:MAG: DUF4333 domain-containing protein [Microbacteriaceae bacterium]|nr:DUF4333 domain-containing protein [Cryobacterium sp.]MCC6375905.1 DUF4333 domain-containing protein [Microbacteriaceae bacterium]
MPKSSSRARRIQHNFLGIASICLAIAPFFVIFLLVDAPYELGQMISYLVGSCAIVVGILGIAFSDRLGVSKATPITGVVLGILALVTTFTFYTVIDTRIDTSQLETNIQTYIKNQTGDLVSVHCPATIPAKRGSEVLCTAKAKDGTISRITVTITDDQGGVSVGFEK